jgi:hypothetical protein
MVRSPEREERKRREREERKRTKTMLKIFKCAIQYPNE